MHQIHKSHLCLVQEIQLNLVAALTYDLYACGTLSNEDKEKGYLLDNILESEIYKDLAITNIINELLRVFSSSYRRLQVNKEVWTFLRGMYPSCTAMMVGYDFVECISNNSKDKILQWGSSDDKKGFSNYYIGPTLGTAFGAICDIGPYLAYHSLGMTQKGLVLIINSHLNIQKGLDNIVSTYKNIEVHDITRENVTIGTLLDYYLSGGNTGMIYDACRDLYENYGIESLYYNSTRKPEEQGIVLNAIDLLTKATAAGARKLGIQAHSSAQEKIKQFCTRCRSKKIVLLTTRDDQWVGGGQDWRNTDIETMVEVINILLGEGFAVARFNKVAEVIKIDHDYFLDLAGLDVQFTDQLLMASYCTYNIGAMTGATDIARQIFGKPTIYIEASNLYVYGLRAWVAVITKSLSINASDLWNSRTESERLEFLLREAWTFEDCEKYGLVLNSRSAIEISTSIAEAIHAIEKGMILPTHKEYCEIESSRFVCPNVSVCSATGKMLRGLLNYVQE